MLNENVVGPMEIAEISEWFDWMRRELPQGGVRLPSEENSVLFTTGALHLLGRLRRVYRHLPSGIEERLIKASILYQCWQGQKEIQENAKWPAAHPRSVLIAVDAVRYVGPIGSGGMRHLVEANDGVQYVVLFSPGHATETAPITEMICNELARKLGLASSVPVVVTVRSEVLQHVRATWTQWPHINHLPSVEYCYGTRYTGTASRSLGDRSLDKGVGRVSARLRIGSLMLDVWLLNLSPREAMTKLDAPKGRLEEETCNHDRFFTGGDWGRYGQSGIKSLPAPQSDARLIRTWNQLEPWLQRIEQIDFNPLWELAFRAPPEWYGGRRRCLTQHLEKIAARGSWQLRHATVYLMKVGYFPSVKNGTVSVEAQPLERDETSA